jgi:succinoglycan biosynthesis protein ExoA
MIQTVSSDPTVSVIIPVRNEERHIRDCVRNILDTSYPRDRIEIVVIDGRSNDRTCMEVERLRQEGLNVHLLDNPKRTPYSGLNIGLSAASGEVIVRVDARSMCPRDYIRRCVTTLLESGADNVGGVQMPMGVSAKQRAIAAAMSHPFGVGNAQFRLGKKSGFVETVYLGCFHRHVFDLVGPYDEDGPVISEDSEMNQRIIRNGGKVYLNKDIVVSYVAKNSLREFWRQYFIYGGARAHSLLRSKRFTAFRQLVPPTFLLSLIFLPVLGFLHWAFLALWFMIVGAYSLLDLAVSASLSIETKEPRIFPWLLLAFPCMHLSWALGFFVRLLEGSHPGKHWRK